MRVTHHLLRHITLHITVDCNRVELPVVSIGGYHCQMPGLLSKKMGRVKHHVHISLCTRSYRPARKRRLCTAALRMHIHNGDLPVTDVRAFEPDGHRTAVISDRIYLHDRRIKSQDTRIALS